MALVELAKRVTPEGRRKSEFLQRVTSVQESISEGMEFQNVDWKQAPPQLVEYLKSRINLEAIEKVGVNSRIPLPSNSATLDVELRFNQSAYLTNLGQPAVGFFFRFHILQGEWFSASIELSDGLSKSPRFFGRNGLTSLPEDEDRRKALEMGCLMAQFTQGLLAGKIGATRLNPEDRIPTPQLS